MIIYGWRGLTLTKGRGAFFCPQCGDTRTYAHKYVRRFFTLYFIPLIPLDKKGEWVECSTCKGTFNAQVLTYRPEEEQAATLAAFQQALRGALIQVLLADERVDDAEVEAVLAACRRAEDHGVTEEMIRAEITQAGATADAPIAALSALTSTLSDHAKETVMESALLVASADGAITDDERALIARIGEALGITPSHLRGIVAGMSGGAENRLGEAARN
ncbi:MAG: TerB family tellurite resistance protein [Phycisphaerales bacterium]|nr:TerB family tellurite resistance protein [Phycisphaerales bacterium]